VRANRRRRVGWGLGGVLGLLIWGGLSGAGAEERLQEEAQKGRWLFPPGRIEWGAQAGGGFALSDYATPLFSLGARVGYVLTEQEVFLRGSLEIVGEPSYFAVVHGRTAHGGDLSALLKYNFWTGTKLTPYLIGGAGLSYASIRVPQGGTNFNFTIQTGIGLHYALSERETLNLEWRYHHFSNGDIVPPNPSLNTSLFLIGFSVLY